MPGISVSGLGSGLDVNNLVSQLVAAEKQPVQQRLAAAESKAQVRLSALGTYRAALANLQAAAADLKTGSALGALTASSSDSSLFGASAAGAAAGRYSVEVVSLARANRLASGTFAGSTSALGAGDVTLTVAGESFTVSLAQGSDTLADLRDAINNASNNSGVSATLINESGGTRLLLSARNTGLANSVSVSSTLLAFSETQGASDAHVRVDGYDAFSAVNSVSGVIDGVTLKLVKAAPGTLATLDVAVDNKSAADAVQKFVGAYNALIVTANSLSRFDVATQTAAALTGDSTVRSAGLQLRALLGGASGGGRFSQLAQVGITTATDGSLQIDQSRLSAALSDDFGAVRTLFAGGDGYATRLDALLDGYLDPGGRIEAAKETLQNRIEDVGDQKRALDRRMSLTEARYLAQFSALDTVISRLQSTSEFLTSQLAALTPTRRT